MQVNASSRFENTLHLYKADTHRHQINHHRVVIGMLRCQYDLMYLRIVFRYFAMPAVSDILIRPNVFEGSTFGWRTDRGFVLLLGVEWRVKINQVNRLGIHTPHNIKIVCDKKRPVFNVHLLDLPAPVYLSPYEGGRVADVPCGTLRSATQTGFVECIREAKNRQVAFLIRRKPIGYQRAGAASLEISVSFRLLGA